MKYLIGALIFLVAAFLTGFIPVMRTTVLTFSTFDITLGLIATVVTTVLVLRAVK